MKLQPRCTLSQQDKAWKPDFGGCQFRLVYSPSQHGEASDLQQGSTTPWGSYLGLSSPRAPGSEALFLVTDAAGGVVCSCSSPGLPGSKGYENNSVSWQLQAHTGQRAWCSPAGHSILLDAGRDLLLFTPGGVHTLQLAAAGEGATPEAAATGGSALEQAHLADGGFALAAISSSSAAGRQLHLWTAPAEGSSSVSPAGLWRQLPLWPHAAPTPAPSAATCTVSDMGAPAAVTSAGGASCFAVAFPRSDMSGQWLACAALEAASPGEVWVSVLQQPLLSALPPTQLLQPGGLLQQDPLLTGSCGVEQPWSWHSLALVLPGHTMPAADKFDLEGPTMGTLQLSAAADLDQAVEVQSGMMAWNPSGTKLAVGVSASSDRAWLLVFASGMQEVHEYCWEDAPDNRPTGLLHPGPRALSSLCWLAEGGGLAVMDTWGQLKVLGAGATLEQLQLIDLSGMTVTFRPTVQLSYSMLLAACSSSAAIRPSFDRQFLLCGIPPHAADQPSQLAVWDGSSLLVVNLLPGVDPSQHVIDQTINARAHLLHGDTKRRLAHQREQERLQALRYSVVQRLPEAPGEEGPAAAGLLSCAAGPTVLQVLLEAPEAEADASGSPSLVSTAAPVQQVLPVPVLANPLVTASPVADQLLHMAATSSSCGEGMDTAGPGTLSSDAPLQQERRLSSAEASRQASLTSNLPAASTGLLSTGYAADAGEAMEQATCTGSAMEAEQAPAADHSQLWQLLQAGDQAFIAGQWPGAAAAYQQAWPLSAGHLMALHICQYDLPGALATVQRAVAEALATVQPQEDPLGEATEEQVAVSGAAAVVLAPLCGLLCGAVCQLLMTCISSIQAQQQAGGGCQEASEGQSGLCLAGSPLYWSLQLAALLHPEELVDMSWAPGQYVQLLPAALITSAAQAQAAAPSKGPAAAASTAATPAGEGGLCLGDLPARAAGYAVLAAAWGGGSMELLPFAASAALHLQDAWGNGNWLAAAVLADGCSRVLREMLAGEVTEEEQVAQTTWDDAARCCLLWRLVDHTGAPLPLLASAAVQVVAAAQQLWGSDTEGCTRVKQQVAAHLWRCTCLRMACAPILGPPGAAQQQQQQQQPSTADIAAEAAPSQATVQQQLLEALAATVQQHLQEDAKGWRASKGAAGGGNCMAQLLQLLLWCCGSPLTVGAVLEQAPQPSKGAATLQARLGTALSRSGLTTDTQWQQACRAASQAASGTALSQSQLAELALQVDMVCLMRALLQVAAEGSLTPGPLQQLLRQQVLEAGDSSRGCRVLEMPGLEVWCQPQEAGHPQQAHTAAGAVERVALVCWLLECRQQASQLLAAGGCRASAANCAAAAVLLAMDGLHPQQALQHAVLQALLRSAAAVPPEVVRCVAASCAADAEAGASKTGALLRQLEEACAAAQGEDVQALDAEECYMDYIQHVQQLLLEVPGAGQEEATFLQQVLAAAIAAPSLQGACGALPPLSSCFIHPLCTATTAAPASEGVAEEHVARLAICAAMVHPASAAAAAASAEEDASTLTAQALAWQQQQVDLILDQVLKAQDAVAHQPDTAAATAGEAVRGEAGGSSPTGWVLEEFLQPAASQLSIGELLREDLSPVQAAPVAQPAAAAAAIANVPATASSAPAAPAPAAAAVEVSVPAQPLSAAAQEGTAVEQGVHVPPRLSARPPPLHLGTGAAPSRLSGIPTAALQQQPEGTLRTPSGVAGAASELPRAASGLLKEASGVAGFYATAGLYSAPNSPRSPRRSPQWAPAAAAAALAAGGLSGMAATMPATPHTPSRLTRLAPNLDAQQQRLLHGLPEHVWEGPGALAGGVEGGTGLGEGPMTPRRSGLRLQPLLRNFSVSSRPPLAAAAAAAGQDAVPATPGGRVSRTPSLDPTASGMAGLLATLRRRTSMAGGGDADLQRMLPAPQYSLQLLQESSQQLVNQQRNSLGATFQALLPEELRLPPGGTGGSLEYRRRSTAGSTGGEGRASIPGSMRSTTEGDQLLVGRRYVASVGSRSIGSGSAVKTIPAGELLAGPSVASAARPVDSASASRRASTAALQAPAADKPTLTPVAEAAAQHGPGSAGSRPQLQLQQDSFSQRQQQPPSRRASSTRHTLAAASFHQELQPNEGLQVLLVPELGSQQKARRVSQEQWAQGVTSLRHITSSSSGRATSEQVPPAGPGGEQSAPGSGSVSEVPGSGRVPVKAASGQLTRHQAPSPTRSSSRQHSTLYSSTYEARELSRRKLLAAASPPHGSKAAGEAHEALSVQGEEPAGGLGKEGSTLPAKPPGQPIGEGVMQDYMPLLGSVVVDSSSAVLHMPQTPPPPPPPAAKAVTAAPATKKPSLRQRMLRGFRSWAQRKQAGKHARSSSSSSSITWQPPQQVALTGQECQVAAGEQALLGTPVRGQPLGEGMEAPPASPMSARLAQLAAQQLEEQRAREQQQVQQRKEAVRESSSYQSIPQLMSIVRKLFAAPGAGPPAQGNTVHPSAVAAAAAARSPAGRLTADDRATAGAVKPPAVSVTWADQIPAAAAAAAGSLVGRSSLASPSAVSRAAAAAAAVDDPLAEYLGCFSPTATSRAVSRQVSSRAMSVSPTREGPAGTSRRSSSASPSRASSSRLLGGGGGMSARLSSFHRGLAAEGAAASGSGGMGDAARGSLVQTGSLPDVGQYWNDSSVYSVDGSVQPSRVGSFKQRTLQQQVLEQQQQKQSLAGPAPAAAAGGPGDMMDFLSTSRSVSGGALHASQRVPLNPMRQAALQQQQQQQQQQGEEVRTAAGAPAGAALYGRAAAMQQSLAGDVKDFFSTSCSGVGASLLASQALPSNPLLGDHEADVQQQEVDEEDLMRHFLATSKAGTGANLLASQAVPKNPMLAKQVPPQAPSQQQAQQWQQQQQPGMGTEVRDFFATSRSGVGPDLLASQQVPHNPLRGHPGSPPPPPLQLTVSPPHPASAAADSSLPPPSPPSPATATSAAAGVQEFLVTTRQGTSATPEALLVSQAVPLNPLRRSLKARSPPTIIAGPPPLRPGSAGSEEGEEDSAGDPQQQQSSSCPGTPTAGAGEFSPLKQRASSFGSHKQMLLHGPSRLSWRSSPHSTTPEPTAAAGGSGSSPPAAGLGSPTRGSVRSPGPSPPQQQQQQQHEQQLPGAGAAAMQVQEQQAGYQRQASSLSSASSTSMHQRQVGQGAATASMQQQQQQQQRSLQPSKTPTPANSQRQMMPPPYVEGMDGSAAAGGGGGGAGGGSPSPRQSWYSTPPTSRRQLAVPMQQGAASPGDNWSGLATSMQRIAHCLEEFLVARSPAGSPYTTQGGAAATTSPATSGLHPAAALLSSPGSPAAAALLSSGMWVNPFWVPGDAAAVSAAAAMSAAAVAAGMPVPGLPGTMPAQLKSFFRGGATAAVKRRTAAATAADAGGVDEDGAAEEDEPGLVGDGIRAEGELIMADPEYVPQDGEDAVTSWGDAGDQSRYQTMQGGAQSAPAAAAAAPFGPGDDAQEEEEEGGEGYQEDDLYEYDAGTQYMGQTIGRGTVSRMLGSSGGGAGEPGEQLEQLPRGLAEAQQLLTQRQTLGRQQQATQQRTASRQQQATQLTLNGQQQATQQRATGRRTAGRTIRWADSSTAAAGEDGVGGLDEAQEATQEEEDAEDVGGDALGEEQRQHMAYLTMAAEAAGVPVQRLTAGLATSSRAARTRGGSRRSVRFTEGQEPGATQSLADWEEADAAAVAAAAAGEHEEATQQTLLQEVQEEDQLLYATGLHVTGTRTLGHPQHRATHQPGVYTTRRTALRASGPAGLGGAAALPGLNTRMHTGGHLRLLRSRNTTGTLRHISAQQARPGGTTALPPEEPPAAGATGLAPGATAGAGEQEVGDGSEAQHQTQGRATGVLPAVEVAEYLRGPRLLRPGGRLAAGPATAATAKKALFASLQQQQGQGQVEGQAPVQLGSSGGTFGGQLRTLDVSSHLDQGVMHHPDSPVTQGGLSRASGGPAGGSVAGHLWHPPNPLFNSSPAVQKWARTELMEQVEGTTLRGTAAAAHAAATVPRPTRLLGGGGADDGSSGSSRLLGSQWPADGGAMTGVHSQQQAHQQQQDGGAYYEQHVASHTQHRFLADHHHHQQQAYTAGPSAAAAGAVPAPVSPGGGGGGASPLTRVTGAPTGTIEILQHSPQQAATAALGSTMHSSYVPGGPAFWEELQEAPGGTTSRATSTRGTAHAPSRTLATTTTAAAAAARAAAAEEARAAAQQTLAERLLATGGRNGSSLLHSLQQQQQWDDPAAAGVAAGAFGPGSSTSSGGGAGGGGSGSTQKRTVLVAVSPGRAATAAAAARRRRGRLQQLAQRGRGGAAAAAAAAAAVQEEASWVAEGEEQPHQECGVTGRGGDVAVDTPSRLLQAAGQLVTGLPPGSPATMAALEVVRGTDALLRTWQSQQQHARDAQQQQEQQRQQQQQEQQRQQQQQEEEGDGSLEPVQAQRGARERRDREPLADSISFAELPGLPAGVDHVDHAKHVDQRQPPQSSRSSGPKQQQQQPPAGQPGGDGTPAAAETAPGAEWSHPEPGPANPAAGSILPVGPPPGMAPAPPAAAASLVPVELLVQALGALQEQQRSMALALSATAAAAAAAAATGPGGAAAAAAQGPSSTDAAASGAGVAGWEDRSEGDDDETDDRFGEAGEGRGLQAARQPQPLPTSSSPPGEASGGDPMAMLLGATAAAAVLTRRQGAARSTAPQQQQQQPQQVNELDSDPDQTAAELAELILSAFQSEGGVIGAGPQDHQLLLQEGQLIGVDGLLPLQQPPAAAAVGGGGPSVVHVMDVSDLASAPPGFLAGTATRAWPPGRPNGWVKALGQGQQGPHTSTHLGGTAGGALGGSGGGGGGWYTQLDIQQQPGSTSQRHQPQRPASSTAGRLQQQQQRQQQGLSTGGSQGTSRKTSALRRSGQLLGIPCVYSGCQHHMQPSGQLTSMAGGHQEEEEEGGGHVYGEGEGERPAGHSLEQGQGEGAPSSTYYGSSGWGPAGLPQAGRQHTEQQQHHQQQHQQRWEDAVEALQAAGLPLDATGVLEQRQQQQQRWTAQSGRTWEGAEGLPGSVGGAAGQQPRQQQQAAAEVEDAQFAAERESLRQALARAEAARSGARATARLRAQQQAARIKAELGDLCNMLKDVDRLAAVMQEESAAVAAELEEQERRSSGGGRLGGEWEVAAAHASALTQEVDAW